MANSYEIPSWAGKPPTGLHLDVLKEDKLVQKLMVDEKRCYLFGRNAQMNDFCIDHASCSRVHAAFVYHKHLNIAYLVDLGSTHGTYIGTLRLEPHKPTQLHVNSAFHFGASTRHYILRERPSAGQRSNIMEDLPINDISDGALLGLPESQTELDNLTEYNTAHNRRISMLGIADDNLRKNKSRKRRNVSFNDEEIIINPEDVDPNIGRFRNLVHTTFIPIKRTRFDTAPMGILSSHTASTGATPSSNNNTVLTVNQMFQHTLQEHLKNLHTSYTTMPGTVLTTTPVFSAPSLYQGLPAANQDNFHGYNQSNDFVLNPLALGSKLGLLLPNPAPDVTPIEMDEPALSVTTKSSAPDKSTIPNSKAHYDESATSTNLMDKNGEPPKKKYAKEAWPGRKPMFGAL